MIITNLEASVKSELASISRLLLCLLVRCHRVLFQELHIFKGLITFEALQLPGDGVLSLPVELEGGLVLEGFAAGDALVRVVRFVRVGSCADLGDGGGQGCKVPGHCN